MASKWQELLASFNRQDGERVVEQMVIDGELVPVAAGDLQSYTVLVCYRRDGADLAGSGRIYSVLASNAQAAAREGLIAFVMGNRPRLARDRGMRVADLRVRVFSESAGNMLDDPDEAGYDGRQLTIWDVVGETVPDEEETKGAE